MTAIYPPTERLDMQILLHSYLSKPTQASRKIQKSVRFSATEWDEVLLVLKDHGNVKLGDFIRSMFTVLAADGTIVSAEQWTEYQLLKELASQ